MTSFPLYDPIIIYSKPQANSRALSVQLNKRNMKATKAKLLALLGQPIGVPVNSTTRQVTAVQQPSSSVTQGATGANGGLMPVGDKIILNTYTTIADLNALLYQQTRGQFPLAVEYNWAYNTFFTSYDSLRTFDGGFGNTLDGMFILDDTSGLSLGKLLGVDFVLGEDALGYAVPYASMLE